MPVLKDLKCSIELSESQRTLQEFGTTYGDGFVETFVPVPSKTQSFSIHLTSDKFIAPGISMYVFVDGVYQCNRNRQDLKLRKGSDSRSIVDFKVRQKEEKQKDGSMIAREWKFEKLNTVSADDAPGVCSANVLDNIGCIEVLVLRCAGPRTAKTVSAMNMDGACDLPLHYLGMDGQSDRRSMYDDREPSFSGPGHSHSHRPPPPLPSYRPPYAETVYSHHSPPFANATSPFATSHHHRLHSKYSEPVSPGARPASTIPSEAFQYGSGPIPTGRMHGSEKSFYHTRPASAVVANAPNVDPAWLNELLTKAVKRGVEEVRRNEVSPKDHAQQPASTAAVGQPPGAWPQSPFVPDAQAAQPPQYARQGHPVLEDRGTAWAGSQGGWSHQAPRERTGTRVNWTEEPQWDSQSTAGSWGAQEETQSDTWDTDETWGTENPEERKGSRWSKSQAPTVQSRRTSRPMSPVATRTRHRSRTSDHRSRKSRSQSRPKSSRWDEGSSSSSEDRDGWTKVDAPSDSPTSLEGSDDTLQPRRSRRKSRTSRDRSQSRKRSSQTRSAHSGGRRSSRHLRGGADTRAPSIRTGQAPSIATATPTIMNAPASMYKPPVYPAVVPIPHNSSHAPPAPSVAPPPPNWASAVAEKLRKHSSAMKTNLPAPFSVAGADPSQGGYRSSSASSWGATKKSKPAEEMSSRSTSWGEKEVGKTKSSKPVTDDTSGWGNAMETGWAASYTKKDGWDDAKDGWSVAEASRGVKQNATNADGWAADQIKKDGDDLWATQSNTWGNEPSKADDKPPVQWNNDTAWPSTPNDNKPNKPPSISKRHTSKSLAKYRKPSTSPAVPQPHWQFPPRPSTTPIPPSSHPTLAPEPHPAVPSKAASLAGLEHQVRAGAGTPYGHAIARPSYVDTLERPYAVFRFKYRSRGVLKALFGDAVPDHGHLSTRTPGGEMVREKEKLRGVSREELVEKMVRLQTRLAEKEAGKREKDGRRKAESRGTESVARDLTEDWVRRQSREPSEKGKGKEKERSEKGEWGNTW